MTKLLLISTFFVVIVSHAQNFWTEYSTAQPRSSEGIRSISIVDENTTWLNMTPGLSGYGEFPRYAKTTNGGTVWTTAPVNIGVPFNSQFFIANIHGISSLVAYAAVSSLHEIFQGGIWKTEDGGTTWTRQNSAAFSNNTSFVNMVYFWNANDGIALGDPADGFFEIYNTSDGGNSWTRVASTPSIVSINSEEYLLTNEFEVYGNTIWAGTTFGRILKSSDKGITWTVSQSPIPDFGGEINGNKWGKLAFSNESDGLLQTSDNLLYKTSDGGLTWTEIFYTGFLRNFNIGAVPGMANTYITLGNQDFPMVEERGSSYSVDGGYTWTSINNNPDTNFVNGGVIEMLNQDYGFASGFATSPTVGGVFKWSGGAMLRQAQLAVSDFPNNNAIVTRPNPTSGLIEINGKNITQIEVSDMLGKIITNMKFNNLDTVNLNLDFLTSGIYLFRVTNENGFFISKVVKQ